MRHRLSTLAVHLTVFALCVLMVGGASLSTVFAQDEGYRYFIDGEDDDGIELYGKCKQFWPSTGRFETFTDGYEYSATLNFQLTQAEKDALVCADEYLELDFKLLGFENPAGWPLGWEDYSINTNIPGGIHDTALGDVELSPAVTGIKVSDLVVGYEYYAGINFSGLERKESDPEGPRVAFEWQVSHWASPLNPLEAPYCPYGGAAGVVPVEECIFTTVRVFLSNGYTAHEYGVGEDGLGQGLTFDGFRFWEFPGTAVSQSPEEIAPEPTIAAPSCDDAGIPQIADALTYSPENPDTATQVEFSVTITNIGCGTFRPEVLAIGGRDPVSEVSDPLQDRDFTLGPGESREISQATVLSIPGSHEFFMVFKRVGGGWNEIPDTSGVSQHIFIDVTEAGVGQVDSPGDEDPATCNDNALPVLSNLETLGDGDYDTTETIPISLQIDNSGCLDYGFADVQVVDYAPDGTTHVLHSESFEFFPGASVAVGINAVLDQPGDHQISVEFDDGSGWQVHGDGSGADGYLDIFVSDLSSEGTWDNGGTIDLSQFQVGCHYFWSDQGDWFANNCDIPVSSGELGPALSEPAMDGCNYLFDGSYFYQNLSYGCD